MRLLLAITYPPSMCYNVDDDDNDDIAYTLGRHAEDGFRESLIEAVVVLLNLEHRRQ